MKNYCDISLLKLVPNILFYYWRQKKLLATKKNWVVQDFRVKTYSRGSTILPYFNHCLVLIYNGNRFTKLRVNKSHFFHKFGEFSYTKIICRHNKKKKKQR